MRRQDDGTTPDATCWPQELQQWMTERGRGSYVNVPNGNVSAVLQEFLSDRVDLRGEVLFSGGEDSQDGEARVHPCISLCIFTLNPLYASCTEH